MKVDLLVKNGKLVLPTGILAASVAVDSGKIVRIAKNSHLPPAERILDAKGNYVLPGIIDGHVHFWDPGFTSREDWSTGTESAAAGGVTTVIEMPTTSPPTITPSAFKEKKKNAGRKAYVDFALHAGITPETILHIPKLAAQGAASFKMFIAEDVREMVKMDEGSVYEALTCIEQTQSVMSVHAETELVPYLRGKLQQAGRVDILAHPESRPSVAEISAVARMLLLSWQTKAHVHFCHLSTAMAAKFVGRAKRAHVPISAETCPQYLIFNEKDYARLGPYLKVNPPIRTRKNQIALWHALQHGILDTVASDHCPFLRKEKEAGWKNIWEAGAGIPGTETMLPLLITEGVNKGHLDILRLVQLLCENPARIFGLSPRKGQLAVGADADLVIVDMKKEMKINVDNMHTKGEFTPYEGRVVRGVPTVTIVRGSTVCEDGEILERQGYGVFIPRRKPNTR
jgi:dihydroorotase